MKKKNKILVITNHSYMLWQFRRELITELLKENEVVISMPFVGHEEDFKTLGCRTIETNVDRRGINPFTDIKLMQAYYKILKNEKPDMVLTYSIKPNVYAGFLCRMKNIPYCINVQGLGTAFQKPLLTQIVTAMYRGACKNAKTVFFENEGNAEVFTSRNIIPVEKQTILPGAGVNLEHYSYVPYPENEKIHFLYLGRIMKEKGMDELFYAIRRLHEEYGENILLDLVGFFEDEYKEIVEELQEEGIVKFHGFQEDPRPFYAAADCVVLPSYHEGMSNVLLEAASTGRMLITSDIPGCREAVENGNTGLLCKVQNQESLYKAMKKTVEASAEIRAMAGVQGRGKMEREFGKGKVVGMTVEKILEQ